MSRRELWLASVAIGTVAIAQSLAHLAVVLGAHRVDTLVDLDRSNGIPDLCSTLALALAATGAALVAVRETASRRLPAAALAVALGALTVADALHDGAHPVGVSGWTVILVAVAAGALLVHGALGFATRSRAILVAGVGLLLASFLTNGLDQWNQWFERRRGDPVAEYQIVTKEGLELLGWSLVALALWDEALRRRRAGVATARASRAPARPTRRAA